MLAIVRGREGGQPSILGSIFIGCGDVGLLTQTGEGVSGLKNDCYDSE